MDFPMAQQPSSARVGATTYDKVQNNIIVLKVYKEN